MHDIVIRGGTIVDGTGKAPFSGDVAIAGGRIAAVGGKLGPAKREIDAAGLMVTPGWVDVHTHYDGQAMWDPLLTPSCWHGVTTVMFGNCGVGFAPVKKHHRQALMDLMEGVEEIPNPVLAAGLNWEWETFPQFMDELERRPRAIDICAQAAHLPTRVYVMGDRALRREPATPDDIAEMRKITIEALRSGAFGFTTSRTDSHKTPDGELVPSRDADDHELLGIGQALGITGTGAFGMNSDFDDEEFELRWIRKQARETGRPVWFLLTDRYSDPQRWRRLITAVHGMRAEGLPVTAQMAGRPIGVMMGIGTALNPFTVRPSYKKLESLPIEEQRKRLRDPEMRRQILAETPSAAEIAKLAQFRQIVAKDFDKFFTMGNPPDYEPGPEKSVAAIAKREGRSCEEVAYDYILGEAQYLYFPRNAQRPGLPARLERRRRSLHLDRRCRRADLHADPLEPRPRARSEAVSRNADQAPDQRNGGFLRPLRPRPAHAGPARRRQSDRLRPPAGAKARTGARHAGQRPPFRAEGRRL
jgi:N-acyl-D-aspartate/D-glutamate deacylase